MNVKQIKLPEGLKKALGRMEKFKYPLLILLVGLVLILLPGKSDSKETAAGETAAVNAADAAGDEDALSDTGALEAKLESALTKLSGAGRVEVVLTLKEGSELVLASDETESDSEKTSQTVLADDGDGGEKAVVVRSKYPEYRGALIVCDGGGDPKVKLEIVSAVSALTGLGSDKITVVKMKTS